MEGSLTGGNRLSSQLVSMFFRSEDISPIYPRRCEEGCVRTEGEGRCVLPPPQPYPGRPRSQPPVLPTRPPFQR